MLLTAAALVGALVVVARAAGWQAGPLYYLVALTPYLGVMLLLIAVAAGLLRAWWLLAPAMALALVVGWWWRPVPIDPPAPGARGMQVMTVNLQFGRADPAAVVTAVRDHSVSVLSVQELTVDAIAALRAAGLDQELPYRMVRAGDGSSPASGTGMWSRWPLTDRADTDGLVFDNVAATVSPTDAPEFTFFAMHAVPPSPVDGNRGSEIFSAIRAFMNSRPGPAIAAGDFNATRDNVPILNLQADGWVDATGRWPAAIRTWPNDMSPLPPLVAIDHVLTRGTPSATSITVIDIPGTDHRALVASL